MLAEQIEPECVKHEHAAEHKTEEWHDNWRSKILLLIFKSEHLIYINGKQKVSCVEPNAHVNNKYDSKWSFYFCFSQCFRNVGGDICSIM